MIRERTPTPWEMKKSKFNNDFAIVPYATNFILAECYEDIEHEGQGAKETCEANAEFIVRACNTHDDLVAALENFEIIEKDDGIWLFLHGHGTTGKAGFNLGKSAGIAVQVARLFEIQRVEALAKARAKAVQS